MSTIHPKLVGIYQIYSSYPLQLLFITVLYYRKADLWVVGAGTLGSYVISSWAKKNRGMGPIVAETRTEKNHIDLQSRGAITKLRNERSLGDGREQALFEGRSPEETTGEKLDGPREKTPEEIEREKLIARYSNCARNVLVCLPPSAHPNGQEYALELYLASRLVSYDLISFKSFCIDTF